PSMSGSPMSSTTRSKLPCTASCDPSTPEAVMWVVKPAAFRPLATKALMRSSSSTIRIVLMDQLLRCQRDDDGERRAHAELGLDLEAAAVGLHDGLDDGQAQPGAHHLAGVRAAAET